MTASEHSYRDATATPTTTAPALKELAELALALLARQGGCAEGGENPDDATWHMTAETAAGITFNMQCTGPDLPATVPAETAHPADIAKERPWIGSHRLTVAAPLVALDIYWRPDTPLRIMTFSRGDWEDQLKALTSPRRKP